MRYFLLVGLVSIFTCTNGQNLSDPCLILDLAFSGNTVDNSGNGYNGVLFGPTLCEDRFGNVNSAYEFDGKDDYIEINNPSKLNKASSKITISTWVKPKEGNYYNTVIAHGGAHLFIQLIKDLNPAFLLQGVKLNYDGATSYYSRLVHLDAIKVNEWTHLAFTFDSTSNEFCSYINGKLFIKTDAVGTLKWKDENWRVGMRITPKFEEPFWGAIDDVKVYKCVLDSSKIAELYNETNVGLANVKEETNVQIINQNSSLKIWLSDENSKQFTAQLFSLDGALVLTHYSFNNSCEIYLNNSLSTGLYILRIVDTTREIDVCKKIIVQ